METKASIIEFLTNGDDFNDGHIGHISDATLHHFSSLYDSFEPVTLEFTTRPVKLELGWGVELLFVRKDARMVIEILEDEVRAWVISHTNSYDWEWRKEPLEVLVGEFNAKYGDKFDTELFELLDL